MEQLTIWKNEICLPDAAAAAAAGERWDSIAKPLDGLGELERIIVKIAAMQGTPDVEISPSALYIFCADNGIIREGVSQSDASVTAAVARSMAKGRSAVCLMAKTAGVEVCPVDIGILEEISEPGLRNCRVRRGTEDFLEAPAMSREEALEAVRCGVRLAGEAYDRGIRLLMAGEMGIGNTTTSAALAAALQALSPDDVCGRGAGLCDESLKRKREVIRRGTERWGFGRSPVKEPEEALRALACLGGLDIAGICGLFIGGAIHRIPVVIDGLICAAAALAAERLVPGTKAYMLASHAGRGRAVPLILEELGLAPVIHADLALGEGTGAVLLKPLLDMALAVYRGETHFSELSMEPYRRYDKI